MSGSAQASNNAARPSLVVTSATTAVTLPPVSLRISSAVARTASTPRAEMPPSAPSRDRALAQALPRPLLAAHTMARRPAIPRSIDILRSSAAPRAGLVHLDRDLADGAVEL